jgi:hypothetical protein
MVQGILIAPRYIDKRTAGGFSIIKHPIRLHRSEIQADHGEAV